MLNEQQIQKAADDFYAAELNRKQIAPLTLSYPDMDMDDAYAVQSAWVQRKIADGRKVIGYKIGLTSRAMQRVMKIETPDYGVLLDDMVFADGSDIVTADFLDPQIETELAFVLKKTLSGEKVTVEEVLDATDYVIPAFELIAARSVRANPETGYTRKVFDTIADNAANAGIISGGRKVNPADVDLRWCGAIVELNGVIEQTGLAAAVLGHPAKGICWIAKRFAAHGVSLEPGQVLLSGSFIAPIKVKAGDKVTADYGDLGKISVNFV
ncbi:2-oxo-hepta-3-ene-1,7-dioic acid hydratase [Haliea sp. AH-315-K21]|uniref:2-oxo-hepta-3-ene-1,7-dioic acid hydratase n=1 Tax=SAR86 cluster bacterium TaxID=2030880 RepID=A0A2A5C749_9GAMM|nr:2-oxo-hepta-3-ene-1,7-dioic acid hydratase [Haliea sp. AH-315-K21]PCJ39405.1 MAG: 2-oxo-hepta-3-ene-1,7-dioic acid hydratase [SAR86 cluster bacterium]